jgi:hypothetical protein
VLGFGYHRFGPRAGSTGTLLAYERVVGCRTGACAITANPYISTLYGALMGYLLSGGLAR